MTKQEQGSQVQSNWLLFLLFLLFVNRKDINKLNFQEINPADLDKKSDLLNRIKEYMDPQEQYIVHSAEIILQIIAKVKTLIDLPQIETSEPRYSSLNLEDRKRSMLMDLSKLFEDDKKMLIHHYTEIFELIFADEGNGKVSKAEKIESMLKAIYNLKNEGKVEESNIMEIIQFFMDEERKDSLLQMVQTFRATDSMEDVDAASIDNNIKHLSIEKTAEDKS